MKLSNLTTGVGFRLYKDRRRGRWQLIGRRWRLVRHSGEGSTLAFTWEIYHQKAVTDLTILAHQLHCRAVLPLPTSSSLLQNYHKTAFQQLLCYHLCVFTLEQGFSNLTETIYDHLFLLVLKCYNVVIHFVGLVQGLELEMLNRCHASIHQGAAVLQVSVTSCCCSW